jgi:hypothetical protein
MAKSIIAKRKRSKIETTRPDSTPTKPKERDEAAEGRLYDAAFTLLSIRRLAIDAIDIDDVNDRAFYLTAIADLARSAFKGMDASLERLSGAPAMGNFATEFDRE